MRRLTSFSVAVRQFLFLYTVASALHAQTPHLAAERRKVVEVACGTMGSPYIPLDHWIYPAVLRLHDLGYLSTFYVGMLPYTRLSLAHALSLAKDDVERDGVDGTSDEAVEIFARLARELAPEIQASNDREVVAESAYARLREARGFVLNDSFHVGQTFINDYGRPVEEGLSALSGVSGYATRGRFNLYARGEYQYAPAGQGYNLALVGFLTADDLLTPGVHAIIPQGAIQQTNRVRMLNAEVSMHLLGHQVAFGSNDNWLGPAHGGSMAWSTNAEPMPAFRIDRVEPMYIPFLSRFTGPFRYEFFVGILGGHDTPNAPWAHVQKVSFKPHPDIEFGFERTVIWGGKGHVPITVGTFFRSFFSPAGVATDVKYSRNDPGARFTTFDFNYRIPWRDHLFTLYADSFTHDNVFPVSNPPRAAWRPGLVVNRLPHLPRVDLRAEAAYTDLDNSNSVGGNFLFFEGVQKNGYTNRLFLMGDPIGREDKGGNAWLTWHLRPDQDAQLAFRTVKAAKDFIPGGTTQQELALNLRLRPIRSVEVKGTFEGELFRGPSVTPGTRRSVSAIVQLMYFPGRLR